MANQATAETSSIFTLDCIREHMKEKKDRTLKSAKLNASLASKIKTKILNNSSIFKISLKHNNKALALALTVEKENTRRLKNEKLFLQREVDKLHFNNVCLRQKLNCLNKTLIEIEAFMNDRLLTAIEMSSFSENPLLLPNGETSCVDHQSKTSHHSARSVGMSVKVPLTEAHNAKQQDSPSVCEKSDDLCNLTLVVSNELCPAQISDELLLESEKKKQKSSEIGKMEKVFDSSIFFRENQPCMELSFNSACMSDSDNLPSVGQFEEVTKHDSPLPFCGNVTERKQEVISCRSKTHVSIVDFHKKVSPSNDWSIDKGKNTDKIKVQAKPNVLYHPTSPLQPTSEFKTGSNEVHFGNQLKPEETVYDSDMELTASDVGKILTITSKAKNKMNSNAKADNISVNLRKVKYSNTGKKDKEKIKNNLKGCSDFHSEKRHKNLNTIDSKSTESDDPKSQWETEQVPEENASRALMLQGANKHDDTQDSQYNDKATRRTYLVKLASPSKQLKNDYLQLQINKKMVSERLENTDNKFQNPDFNSPNNEALSKDYCTKSLPCRENHISSVLSLQQNLLDVNEKHIKPKRNKTFQISSKISKTNYCKKKIGEHSESSSKNPGAKVCKLGRTTKQDQKNNIKNECHKEDNYSDRRETQTSKHCVGIKKENQKNNKVSLGNSKSVLGKASHKTNIQPGDFTECTVSVKQELKNEHMLNSKIVHGNNTTKNQQNQGILAIQTNVTVNKQQARSSLKKVDEYNVNMLKKGVGPILKANKKTSSVISSDDHTERSERLISEFSEASLEECNIRQVDQMEQNILDDQNVRTESDLFMNSKPAFGNIMIEESCLLKFSPVTCFQDMPFSSCSFLQEGLPHMELSAVDYDKSSENIPMLKNSEIFEKHNYEKILCTNRTKKKTETAFKGSCHTPSGRGNGTNALQDMTNTSLYLHTSLPKLPNVLEESSTPLTRRRRVTVCYKEPKLNRKLRRGDQFTDMEFLNSPVFKVKNGRTFKSKSRLI